MAGATPLPRVGEVFFDDRGEDRVLRLSWHPDAEVMVLSIWNGGACTGTFRLAARDVPVLMETLSQGVPVPQPRGRRHAAHAAPADDEPAGRPPAPAEPNPYTYPEPDPATAPAAAPYAYPEPDPAAAPAPAPPWPPPQQTFPMTGEYRAPRHRS
ncbi:hypothetical protein ACRYCC_19590 [Actinomadura scrupuli]|uniref:hypothetical protein n=1 Tax=Actinomadura scrupuli TaxID=559629 RepID=UPI003D97784B